jgi:cytochrome bd ubiquinol oxidase subunit I
LTLFGIPNMQTQKTDMEIKVPFVLGLISTRSLDRPVAGILELVDQAEVRIRSGILAYDAVEKLKVNDTDMAARAQFEAHKRDLGYGYLLKSYVSDPRTATNEQIVKASLDVIPNVPVMFWTFRVMAGIGFAMIALFAVAFLLISLRKAEHNRLFLMVCVAAIPLPWIAIESGWLLAEIGRQPWAVEGVLPTFMGASSLTKSQIWMTIVGFTLMYGTLAVIEVKLLLKTIKKGPYASKMGHMHDEAEVSPLEGGKGVTGPA